MKSKKITCTDMKGLHYGATCVKNMLRHIAKETYFVRYTQSYTV